MISTLNWGEHVIVKYSEDGRDEILAGLQSGAFSGINLARYLGHTPQTLSRLFGLPNLKILHLQDLDVDLGSFDQLPELEQLTICETKQTLDLARLPALRELRAVWHPKLFQNVAASNVSSLHVWKYRPKVSDLTQAPPFSKLVDLELVQSNITSLLGIRSYPLLQRLDLHMLNSLQHLTELSLRHLRVFIAHGCPKITDHENLATCRSLEILNMSRCGTMKSVGFVDNLPYLKSFRFLDTAIADGDYSHLRRLEDVWFTDSRKIDYKTSDFRQTSENLAELLTRS